MELLDQLDQCPRLEDWTMEEFPGPLDQKSEIVTQVLSWTGTDLQNFVTDIVNLDSTQLL